MVYHHIEKKDFNKFTNHLKILKKKWKFITPVQFENHICGKKKLKGKNLLLTFDDGFKSNYTVEKNILRKLNIKSIFFVPSDFIKFKSSKKSKKFIHENILDNEFDIYKNKLSNMTIQNLKSLLKSGNLIGCHTKTHANLGKINNRFKLKNEILQSSKYLESLLRVKINHFAFTYGNYDSMSNESLKMTFSKYKFVYSCLRGNNFFNKRKSIIKRDTIYLDSSNDLSEIFLSGLIDLKYFFQIQSINKRISNK